MKVRPRILSRSVARGIGIACAVFLLGSAHTARAGFNEWTSHGPGVGDFIYAFAIDPTTPRTFYVGTEGNGVFKSTDGAGSWRAVNTGLTGRRVYALALDSTAPGTLYATSGTCGGGIGCGLGSVFKSTDGAGTWQAANTGLTGNDDAQYAFAIDPTTPSTLYVGRAGFKSTDGGGTWQPANSGLTGAYISALAIDPKMPHTLYAGTDGDGVFKSTDGGGSWQAVNSGFTAGDDLRVHVYALAIDPNKPRTLYAGTCSDGGVFKSTDGAGSWQEVLNLPGTGGCVQSLVIDPTVASTLYAGMPGFGIFKSTDEASSWQAFSAGLPSTNELAIDPLTPTTLYAAGGGNLFSIEQVTAKVVGTGSAASCTDAALDAALVGGGLVTFNCGSAPLTIDISSGTGTKTIAADTTIDGGGLITVSGGHSVPLFSVNAGVSFTVKNLTIADGLTSGDGAGIHNDNGALIVTNCAFTGNSADAGNSESDNSGGAIFNDSGTLTVSNSTFTGNRARVNSAPARSRGGAIFNKSGTLAVTDSTFSHNDASGHFANTRGGAISNESGTLIITGSTFVGNGTDFFGPGGGIDNGGSLTVTNSTFTGNSASGRGGGIYSFGMLTVTNSTLINNSEACGGLLGCAPGSLGAGISGGGSVLLHNTILANNIAVGASGPTSRSNCFEGITTDGGHNLDDGASCGFSAVNGSLSNTDPQLDPAGLQDNGGPTQTVALCRAVGLPAGCSAASPAIDAGDDEAFSTLGTDQRGFSRKSSLHVDIGAYEVQGATITVNDTGDNTTAHDAKCTLREALANLNALDDTTSGDCAAGTGTGTTVVFDLALPATIKLTTSTELVISGDVTISAPTTGALAVDGNHATRVFEIMAGTVRFANLTIQNGAANGGGGIMVDSDTRVTLTNCTLSGNSASGGKPFFGIVGGGIAIAGTATLTNCTLNGNSGGALYNTGTVTLTNCTLTSNTSDSIGSLVNSGMATLINCTLSGNSGGALTNGGTAMLTNTIVANSLDGGNCGGDVAMVDGGHNLSSDDTCFSGPSLLNTDPRLAPLADYGGPTVTLALCTAVGVPDSSCDGPSPAIDAGDDAVTGPPMTVTTDQRGQPRKAGLHVDIGAYEVQPGDRVLGCRGDCNDDQQVTVDEVLMMVDIALGSALVTECDGGDSNQDGTITVDEILAAVSNALDACPATPTPAPTRTPTIQPTPTITPTPTPTTTGTPPTPTFTAARARSR